MARRLKLDRDELVALHTRAVYDVFAIGFLQGFPYAGYLPHRPLRPAAPGVRPGSRFPPARSPSPAVRRASIPANRPAAGTCWVEPRSGSPIPTRSISRSAQATASSFKRSLPRNSRTGAMSESEASSRLSRPRSIDLNADLGEGFPNDRDLLHRVTSASICCGAHAGDPASIGETLRLAAEAGVIVGAHPGFADREGFGRRVQSATVDEVERLILDQVAGLRRLADLAGVTDSNSSNPMVLYTTRPKTTTRSPAESSPPCTSLGLPLLGQPGTRLESLAREKGIRYLAEGFPDRRYRPDGSLVPRGEPGAVIVDRDELEASLVRLVSEGRVATLCIHGDEPEAVANADRIRGVLARHGIEIRSFSAL